jgi:hypothetical protein
VLAAGDAPPEAIAALALAEVEPAEAVRAGDGLPSVVAAAAAELRAGDPPVARVAPTAPDDIADAPPTATDAADEAPSLPERARATTAWGGLVFALHAVAELDPVARFAGVPLPVALHALALALAPAAPADPAALAFAGLPPDAEVPEWQDRQPSPLDRAVAAAAADVRTLLAERLEVDPAALDLHALLRRRAEIVADPGWIEVHLALDEVDVDVRRAGLDLDPGHLPFLGCVVRIVYA